MLKVEKCCSIISRNGLFNRNFGRIYIYYSCSLVDLALHSGLIILIVNQYENQVMLTEKEVHYRTLTLKKIMFSTNLKTLQKIVF